jgi:hypothetical protein
MLKTPPWGFEHLIDGGGIDGWHFDVQYAQHDRGRTTRSAGVLRLSTLASQPSTIRAVSFLDQYSRMYTDVQIPFSATSVVSQSDGVLCRWKSAAANKSRPQNGGNSENPLFRRHYTSGVF